MQETADAVVIGGGIMGASTAHFLAKKGVGKVVLLEKRTLAAVSTGHSAANIRCSYSNPVTVQLALRSFDMFENDREEMGWRHRLPANRHDYPARERARRRRQNGARVRERTPHRDPGTRTRTRSGNWRPSSTWTESSAERTSRAAVTRTRYGPHGPLVRAAAKWGLVAYEGVSARRIRVDGDRVSGVESDQGVIQTGPGGQRRRTLGDPRGEVSGPPLLHSLEPGSRSGSSGCRRTSATFPSSPIPGATSIFGLNGRGNCWPAWTIPRKSKPLDIDDYDASLDANSRRRIERGLFRRIPSLRDAEFDRGWASIYTITDDWHPVVGPEGGPDGYYACFGGSGHGFKLGPPIGESLASIMLGQDPRIDLHPLRPSRFEEGDTFTSAWGAGNRA